MPEDEAVRGEAGRTPGPWEYNDATGYRFLIHRGKKVVAEIKQENNPEARGDARLIVRAVNAHEGLVAALREALRYVRPVHGDVVADRLGAALSKAEGGTP